MKSRLAVFMVLIVALLPAPLPAQTMLRISTNRPAVVRDKELSVPLELRKGLPQHFQVLTSAGKVWNPSTNAITTSATSTNLAIRANQQYIIRADTVVPIRPTALSTRKVMFPGLLVHSLPAATNSGPVTTPSTNVLSYELFLRVLRSPPPWDDAAKAYVTDLEVGFDASDNTSRPLSPGVQVHFFTTNCTVKPAQVSIDGSGTEHYQTVRLVCERNDLQTGIDARSDLGEISTTVPFLALGNLTITPASTKIFGYGLGHTVLTLRRFSKEKVELRDGTKLEVDLKVKQGEIVPPGVVTIEPQESATTVELRSSGRGTYQVEATADGQTFKSDPIEFIFPTAFLGATVLGAGLGAAGRVFREAKKGRKKWLAFLGEGLVTGLLAVAASSCGLVVIKLLPSMETTEVGALVIGAAGGYLGTPLLDRIFNRSSPADDSQPKAPGNKGRKSKEKIPVQ